MYRIWYRKQANSKAYIISRFEVLKKYKRTLVYASSKSEFIRKVRNTYKGVGSMKEKTYLFYVPAILEIEDIPDNLDYCAIIGKVKARFVEEAKEKFLEEYGDIAEDLLNDGYDILIAELNKEYIFDKSENKSIEITYKMIEIYIMIRVPEEYQQKELEKLHSNMKEEELHNLLERLINIYGPIDLEILKSIELDNEDTEE